MPTQEKKSLEIGKFQEQPCNAWKKLPIKHSKEKKNLFYLISAICLCKPFVQGCTVPAFAFLRQQIPFFS